jgi:hypothetical protein
MDPVQMVRLTKVSVQYCRGAGDPRLEQCYAAHAPAFAIDAMQPIQCDDFHRVCWIDGDRSRREIEVESI